MGEENAEMENRNQHMQHAKSGAMRGVAAQPAQQQQHVALRHASAPGKQKRVKNKKKNKNPLKKEAKRSALHDVASTAALEMAKSLRIVHCNAGGSERERHCLSLSVFLCV